MSFIQKKAAIKRHLIDMVKRFQTAVNDRLDKIMVLGLINLSERDSNGSYMNLIHKVIRNGSLFCISSL